MSRRLLTTQEAARYLQVSPSFLERDRWSGARIPFIRIGSRSVRYRQIDLDDYLEARIFFNTITKRKVARGQK